PSPVDWLDYRPVAEGSLLHPADPDGREHVHPAAAQPDSAGPDAGQGNEDAADHLHLLLPVVPGWSGAVLGGQQHPVDRATVVHYPADRRRRGEGLISAARLPSQTPRFRGVLLSIL